jgi:hypothetical protein
MEKDTTGMINKMEQDFDIAGDMINELIDDFDSRNLDAGASMGGALTAILFRLMISCPDKSTAMGMLASALAQASLMTAGYEADESTKH